MVKLLLGLVKAGTQILKLVDAVKLCISLIRRSEEVPQNGVEATALLESSQFLLFLEGLPSSLFIGVIRIV